MRGLVYTLLITTACTSSTTAATGSNTLLRRTTNLPIDDLFTPIPWQREAAGTTNLWDAGHPTRITIATSWGNGPVLLIGGVSLQGLTPSTEDFYLIIGKNGQFAAATLAATLGRADANGYGDATVTVSDPSPQPGDYYELGVVAEDPAHGQTVSAALRTFFQAR